MAGVVVDRVGARRAMVAGLLLFAVCCALAAVGHLTKTATAALLVEYEADGDEVPHAGTRSAVIDDDERVIGVLVTMRVEHLRLAEVFWEFADAEGEGFTDVDDWRRAHEGFWNREVVPRLRRVLDPGFALDDDTVVVCEWFVFEPVAEPVPWPGPPEPE